MSSFVITAHVYTSTAGDMVNHRTNKSYDQKSYVQSKVFFKMKCNQIDVKKILYGKFET